MNLKVRSGCVGFRNTPICTTSSTAHRTVQEEFVRHGVSQEALTSLEELQADLDDWLAEYNRTRPHSGKYCYGKTPMQTFLDSAHLAREKMLDSFSHAAPQPERSPAEARSLMRLLDLTNYVRSSLSYYT